MHNITLNLQETGRPNEKTHVYTRQASECCVMSKDISSNEIEARQTKGSETGKRAGCGCHV